MGPVSSFSLPAFRYTSPAKATSYRSWKQLRTQRLEVDRRWQVLRKMDHMQDADPDGFTLTHPTTPAVPLPRLPPTTCCLSYVSGDNGGGGCWALIRSDSSLFRLRRLWSVSMSGTRTWQLNAKRTRKPFIYSTYMLASVKLCIIYIKLLLPNSRA